MTTLTYNVLKYSFQVLSKSKVCSVIEMFISSGHYRLLELSLRLAVS